MRGRGACQLDEIRRCTFDLEANLARRDHHGRDIVHALVKHGRERLFHADRRAAAAYIAGKAQQFLDMHHLDRLFACRLGCFFQVKLLCDRNNEYMKATRFATCNQRLEYLIRVLTEQFRNRNTVYGVLAVRVFVRLIGDLVLLEHTHYICFIRSHIVRSYLQFIQIL